MGASFVWLGDEDPAQQVITHHGLRFVKGEPTKVDDEKIIGKLSNNAMFSKSKEDVVESKEPPEVDPEEGTEREAVKKQLDLNGIEYDGRSSLANLRALLAKHKA